MTVSLCKIKEESSSLCRVMRVCVTICRYIMIAIFYTIFVGFFFPEVMHLINICSFDATSIFEQEETVVRKIPEISAVFGFL